MGVNEVIITIGITIVYTACNDVPDLTKERRL